jgi:hypothetical protein
MDGNDLPMSSRANWTRPMMEAEKASVEANLSVMRWFDSSALARLHLGHGWTRRIKDETNY